MKNSKVLSLLTAGALVVSSFSGLAMNGMTSLAAAADVTAACGNDAKATTDSSDTSDGVYVIKTGAAPAAVNTVTFTVAAGTKIAVGDTKAEALSADLEALNGAITQASAGSVDSAAATTYTVKPSAQHETGVVYVARLSDTTDTAASYVDKFIFVDNDDDLVIANSTRYQDTATDAGGAPGLGIGMQNVTVALRGTVELYVDPTKSVGLTDDDFAWSMVVSPSVASVVESGLRTTVTLNSGAKPGDQYVVSLKVNNVLIDAITVVVAEEVTRTVDDIKVTEFNGNSDITGGSTSIQFDEEDIEGKVDYEAVVVGADAHAKLDGKTLKWSIADGTAASAPTYGWKVTKVTFTPWDWSTKKAKEVIEPADSVWSEYFTMADSARNSAKRFEIVTETDGDTTWSVMNADGWKQISAEIEISVEGYAVEEIDAANIAADAFRGTAKFTLNVLDGRDVTVSKLALNGPDVIEAGDGTYQKYTVEFSRYENAGRFPQDGLYYVWNIVDGALLKGLADDMAKVEKAEDEGKAYNYSAGVKALYKGVSGIDGANVFELDGKDDHSDVVRVRAMSNAAAHTYTMLVRVYGNEAEYKKSAYNLLSTDQNAGWALKNITVLNANMTVKLDLSKIGTDGLVTLPDGAADYEGAVTVKSSAGTNLTESCGYKVIDYADYMYNLADKGTVAQAISATAGEKEITVNKGKLTISKKAEGGAYVVVATDNNLGVTGVSDEIFMVKTPLGKDVTGLEMDQYDIVLDNKNAHATIYAKILPVKYFSNGYTAIEDESAEIDAIIVSSDNESVVVAKSSTDVKTWRQPVGNTSHLYDNTRGVDLVAKGAGTANVTVTTVDGGFTKTVKVTVRDSGSEPEPTPEPEKEHKAGDAFTVDGVSVFVNADGKTVTVTDVTVVGKTATIPATVDGMDVTTIAAQAFKKSDAKTIYVKAAVTDIEKGAFKKAKTKKIFFYEPAALNTVAKNAFKGANVKVVGVGGSFSESAASQLKKAGASKVKNNGTAK